MAVSFRSLPESIDFLAILLQAEIPGRTGRNLRTDARLEIGAFRNRVRGKRIGIPKGNPLSGHKLGRDVGEEDTGRNGDANPLLIGRQPFEIKTNDVDALPDDGDALDERLFQKLQIAVVAGEKAAGDVLDDMLMSRHDADIPAQDFEPVEIPLLRHDARPGDERIAHTEEAQFLRREEEHVLRKPAEREHHLNESFQGDALELSAACLARERIELQSGETERLRRSRPVERQGNAEPCRTSKRIAIDVFARASEELRILQQVLREARKVVSEA